MDKKKMIYEVCRHQLGKAHSTAYRYAYVEGTIPAHIAIKIEQVSEGKITAQSLIPELFLPSNSLKNYSNSILKMASDIEELHPIFVKMVSDFINFIETEQPEFAKQFLIDLNHTTIGDEYLKQRELYAKLQ